MHHGVLLLRSLAVLASFRLQIIGSFLDSVPRRCILLGGGYAARTVFLLLEYRIQMCILLARNAYQAVPMLWWYSTIEVYINKNVQENVMGYEAALGYIQEAHITFL